MGHSLSIAMDSERLFCAARSHPRLCQIVRAVCTIADLPNEISVYPSAYIVDTTLCRSEKRHWVALWFGEKGDAEFFDSHGRYPRRYGLGHFLDRNASDFEYNGRSLQHRNTQVSGQYCLYYLHCKSEGQLLKSITDQFGLDRLENDIKVHSFVEVNFKQSVQGHGIKQKADATWHSRQKKRVTFAPDAKLEIVHQWVDEGKESRKSPWMTTANDRFRFEHRIRETEKSIGYIFSPKHRMWWMSRFSNK